MCIPHVCLLRPLFCCLLQVQYVFAEEKDKHLGTQIVKVGNMIRKKKEILNGTLLLLIFSNGAFSYFRIISGTLIC